MNKEAFFMTAQKKNHRPGKTFLVVFCSLLLLIGLVLLGGRLWFRLPVPLFTSWIAGPAN